MTTEVALGDERPRSSIEKKPIIMANRPDTIAVFDRLPDEIIEQILQATDSNGFASLALLNSKWRSVAQQAHLYAHHLANCPSYSMSHSAPPAANDDNLPKLRQLFAREVKRNLFEAYLRPSKTIIKLISNSISSSSCPGGEGIQFSPSPKGQHLLAYNSSRIYVIDTRGQDIAVKREFKILRRPAATCIKDDGTMLAVLLTEMQVDIYNLKSSPPKRVQSIILDHSPRSIAISPCGTVLAAAYEGGIEVTSLGPTALSTDRRAVKCDAVDILSFSFDGTQILGTTVHSSQPNTVILTAPYYDPGNSMGEDNMSALWTTSILFPNTSRDCSHAVLIQNGKYEEAGWTFTYDRSFETFRAVRIDDLRNGTTYFTGPVPAPASQSKLLPCTLPAASYHGELVSAGFQGKEVWLYGIPEDLDAVPDHANTSIDNSNSSNLMRRNSGPSIRAVSRSQETGEAGRVPQWQLICNNRNTLVGGYKIEELDGVSMVKWVAGFRDSGIQERLVIAARNVVPGVSVTEDEGIDFVDGGRITIVDFDYAVRNGTETEVIIEVGTKEPEVLEEEHRDLATEVAIVRRRTVAQQRGNRSAMIRATTTANRPPPLPTQTSTQQSTDDDDDPLRPRRVGAPPPPRVVEPAAEPDDTEEVQSIEEQEALESPYAHASPRSGTTLRRAATAAAANRRLHPQAAAGNVEYRRADGRAEHPHESDADNWVPPPPPYQKEDPGDLPAFMRHAMPTGAQGQPGQSSSESKPNPPLTTLAQQQTSLAGAIPPVPALPRVLPVPQIPLQAPQAPWHRREGSGSSVHSRQSSSQRPGSRSSRYLHGENIYDVSPPESPAPGASARRPERVSSLHPNETRAVSNPGPDGRSPMTLQLSRPPAAQYQSPTLPRIQTAPQHPGGPPALDLQIPSPSLHNFMQGFGGAQPVTGPGGRRLSNSMTWPAQPQPRIVDTTTGYPYSAPPLNMGGNGALARSYAVQTPGQVPNPGSGIDAPYQLSGSVYAPRAPIGNQAVEEHRRSSYQRPLSQQQQYPQYQQNSSYEPRCHSQPQPHYAQDPPQLQIQVPATPQEDVPLIISTPKGVTGAFDPPDRRISGRRAETPILAPVPRHPRPTAQAVLRPTVERLENIYTSAQGGPQAVGPSSFLSPRGGSGSGSVSTNTRVASLNRKQSRAERSAAKNIADAKRRGWAGRTKSSKRKKKQQERDFDAASSAAWTDVTTFSHRSLGFGRNRGGNNNDLAAGQQGKADKNKCVMM
ncbi:hypothetical protein OQA88_3875 [Cercophora sp. LCS_1]